MFTGCFVQMEEEEFPSKPNMLLGSVVQITFKDVFAKAILPYSTIICSKLRAITVPIIGAYFPIPAHCPRVALFLLRLSHLSKHSVALHMESHTRPDIINFKNLDHQRHRTGPQLR